MNATATNLRSEAGVYTYATEEFKGHTLLVLNPLDKWPVKFGLTKARVILENLDEVKSFVENDGRPAHLCGPSAAEAAAEPSNVLAVASA